MITASDLLALDDGVNGLEHLEEITWFCLYELMEHHENPDMILLIMDLAGREKKRVYEEMRQVLDEMRELAQPPESPLPPPDHSLLA